MNWTRKCSNYEVFLYSTTKGASIGSISYDHFIDGIKDKSEKFDADNILFEGLTVKEMENLLEY